MEATTVLRKPVLTEKSTFQMNELGKYTFEIDGRASKDDVKAAIEKIYGVKVEAVHTKTRKGGVRRLKTGVLERQPTKTATVTLREGDVIELI